MTNENTQDTSQKNKWDTIWSRRGPVNTFINFGRETYNFLFRSLLQKHITGSTRMIELGCGTATLSLSLAHTMKHYTGIDYSDKAVILACRNAEYYGTDNVEIFKKDIFDIDSDFMEKFDLVWSQGLIEHFPTQEPVVYTHWKLAAPGGIILISVPYKYSYHAIWYFFTRPRCLRRFWPWTDQGFLTRSELLSLGQNLSSQAAVFFLQPFLLGFLLGIIVLRVRKPD